MRARTRTSSASAWEAFACSGSSSATRARSLASSSSRCFNACAALDFSAFRPFSAVSRSAMPRLAVASSASAAASLAVSGSSVCSRCSSAAMSLSLARTAARLDSSLGASSRACDSNTASPATLASSAAISEPLLFSSSMRELSSSDSLLPWSPSSFERSASQPLRALTSSAPAAVAAWALAVRAASACALASLNSASSERRRAFWADMACSRSSIVFNAPRRARSKPAAFDSMPESLPPSVCISVSLALSRPSISVNRLRWMPSSVSSVRTCPLRSSTSERSRAASLRSEASRSAPSSSASEVQARRRK